MCRVTQPDLFDDDLLFVPAAGTGEAAARLFSLTGAEDPGTRGPKRSLEALASSLGIEVPLAATNAVLGAQLASALGVQWQQGAEFDGQQVTLDGLNALLRASSRRLWRTSRRPFVESGSYMEVIRTFPNFRPAADKQEAVDRLSDLVGVDRDRLGPGGKEHRVTFDSVARRLAPDLLQASDARRSKHGMVAALCQRLSVPWLRSAGSTGQSVTLQGLNLLLAGAERRLSVTSSGWATPQAEAAALVRVLREGLPQHWDGPATVEQMRADGSRNWRQMEWPGFYFEEQVAALLNVAYPTPPFGGPRRTYGSTTFDYASATRVWDAKVHTVVEVLKPSMQRASTASSPAILNDAVAIRSCLQDQGLGFLVLDGAGYFDETLGFDEWHRSYTREGRQRFDYTSNSGRRRRRKAAFDPVILRALWIQDLSQLDAGVLGGWISQEKQGAQPVRAGHAHGAERNDKFHLKVHKSAPWVVASEAWGWGVDCG